MVCKQFWSDDRLAQPPLLWIPHSRFAQLGRFPTAPQDRNTLSDRHIKEYKKAAVEVVKSPWSLHRAGAYLLGWVADNEARKFAKPPAIPFLLGESPAVWHWAESIAVEWRDYAPLPPVAITIGPARRCRLARKRPHEEPAGCVAAPLPPNDDGGEEPAQSQHKADRKGQITVAAAGPGVRLASGPCAPAAAPLPAVPAVPPLPPAVPPPARAPAPQAMGMSLGCSRCRVSPKGCAQCRNEEYRRKRVRREAAGGSVTAGVA